MRSRKERGIMEYTIITEGNETTFIEVLTSLVVVSLPIAFMVMLYISYIGYSNLLNTEEEEGAVEDESKRA